MYLLILNILNSFEKVYQCHILLEDGNIIKVNLRRQQDEFSYQAIYGIDRLFQKSLVFVLMESCTDRFRTEGS